MRGDQMKFSWGDSIFFAFLWASVWAGALTCYVLDWKVEWMQPKLWFLYVKKKLNKSKSIFFKATKISQKVLNPFETVLSALEDGNIQNSSVNIGQSYRQKIEHEMKLLQANDITHEIRIAYAKLPEANKKNHDFKHWNDAGREWREAILQGTVSNRYRNKKSGKILYEDFFSHGAILLRQSRHIRHDEVESKNRNEEQQFYSEYQKIMCPSCGAEISLNSNEVHCPYCGGYIKSDFFDWQIEELLIYQDLNPNDYNYKMVAATLLVFFLPAVPCFRFIQSVEIILAVPFVLTVILAVILGAVLLRSKNSTEGLEEQIVRYDEKVLLVDLNEALNDAELTSDLLFYSVDKLQLKAVDNTETQTTITIQAILHKLILQNNQKIIKKDKKMELKLYRARHPRRMKSKGQAVFSEKECPSCGANFMPDKNGCCSYCGYQLTVDNSKWRLVNL